MNPTSHRLIPSEQDRLDLLRALTAWTGNPAVADELVQQTMIEAWKSNRQPVNAEWRPWLFGVARNVLLRWRRELASELRRSIAEPANEAILGAMAADIEIDAELEQQEIVSLLHDMLDELPAETRQVLLLKYIDELPQAEIAGQLGLHEKALEGRLYRGKQKLRQHLLQYKPDAAVSLGILTEGRAWQPTAIWCRTCGKRELMARWTDAGAVCFDCPSCQDGERMQQLVGGLFQSSELQKRPSFRQIVNFFITQTDAALMASVQSPPYCPGCANRLTRTHDDLPEMSLTIPVSYSCPACGANLEFENLFECAISGVKGRTFLSQFPKVRSLPLRFSSYQNVELVEARWIAISANAEFSAWHDSYTGQLIDVQISSR